MSCGLNESAVDGAAASAAVLGFPSGACAGGWHVNGIFRVVVMPQSVDLRCHRLAAILSHAGAEHLSFLRAGGLFGDDAFVP